MAEEDAPPIADAELRDLFASLNDTSATGYACDHRFTLAESFLRDRRLPVQPMNEWLRRHGAGCDCEIILNTAADWGERVGFVPDDQDD